MDVIRTWWKDLFRWNVTMQAKNVKNRPCDANPHGMHLIFGAGAAIFVSCR
jgi:hypothetical protein